MADNSVGDIGLNLNINSAGFNKQLSGISRLASKAGKMLAGAFAVKKLVDFGSACLSLGSDLAEVQNVVDVVFTSMSDKVDEFAKNAANTYGLSETMAKKYTGTFGAMAKSFGFAEAEAYDMATALTGLTGDVASFYNMSQDEAYTKLKSVFTGETESLKELGVVMTQTALDQYALSNGFGKTTSAMTEAEKVALRYAFVQSQLTSASGDFARTSDSWANQVRILSLQFDSLKASIGQGLIAVLTPVIKLLNFIISKLVVAANAFKDFMQIVFGKTSETSSGASTASSTASDLSSVSASADTASQAVSGTTSKVKKLKRELAGFDQITKLSDTSDSNSDGGSSGGSGGSGAGSTGIDTSALDTGLEKSENKLSKFQQKCLAFKKTVQNIIKSIADKFAPTIEKFAKPFKLVGGAIVGLVRDTRKAFSSVYDKYISPAFKTIGGVFSHTIGVLIDALNKYLLPVVEKIGKDIVKLRKKYLQPIIDLILEIVGKIIYYASKIIKALQPVIDFIVKVFVAKIANKLAIAWDCFKTVFEGIATVIKGALKVINGIIDVIAGVFTGDWKKAWDGVKEIFEGVWDAITGVVKTAWGIVKKTFAPTVLYFTNLWTKVKIALEPIIKWAKKTFKKVVNVIKHPFKAIKAFFKSVAGFITKPFKSIGKWFKKKFSGVHDAITGISDKLSDVKNSAKEKLKGLKDKISSGLEGAGEWFSSIGEGFADTIENLKDKIDPEKLAEIGEFISDNIGEVKAKISAWFADKESEIKNKWDSLTSNVKEKVADLKARVASKWSDLKDKWNSIVSNVKEKTANMKAKVKSKWSDLKNKWSSLMGHFKDKSVSIGLSIAAKVKDIKKWFNEKVIDKVNAKIHKIPLLKSVSIPHLAQGGYVKANTPQLAMIGDNRHQGEVVAPDNKLEEMAARAAAGAGGVPVEVITLMREIVKLLKELELTANISSADLTNIIIKVINQKTKATGSCPINV